MQEREPSPGDRNGDGDWHVGYFENGEWFIDPTPLSMQTAAVHIDEVRHDYPDRKYAMLKESVGLDIG